MKRKIIGWLIVLAMCMTLMPTTAFAADVASGNGWRLDGSGRLYITGSFNGGGLGWNSAPWSDYREQVRFVYTSPGASVWDCRHLFYECVNLKSADLSNLDTSRVTEMDSMFEDCSRLETINFTGLDTSNVTSMYRMFNGCSALTTLDVSGFNTAKVTSFSYMFYGCSSLTSLDVSKFNTANAKGMKSMFEDCSSLKTLDVSKFNTSNVTTMSAMFWGCKSLTKLDVSKFDTRNVTSFSAMFNNCSSLTVLDVSGFDTSGAVGFMNFMFHNCSSLTKLDVSNFDTSGIIEMAVMFSGCSSLQSLDLSHFDTAGVRNMTSMFSDCTSLKSINLTGMNTAKVTSMDGMFKNCSSLSKLDISHFVISDTTETSSMIKGCTSLTEYGTSRDLMKSTVDDLVEICPLWKNKADGVKYYGKNRLLSLYGKYTLVKDAGVDIEEYGPSWVLDKNGQLTIFGKVWGSEFESVKEKIKTVVTEEGASTTNASRMFYQCYNLVSADLSKLDISETTDMHDMFFRCENLREVKFIDCLTQKVTDMSAMFCGCTNLRTLDLSRFYVFHCTDMQSMFSGCENLETLDISSLGTYALTNAAHMFKNCRSLTSIEMGDFALWLGKATIVHGMFENCSSLTSLNLSSLKFDSLLKGPANGNSLFFNLLPGCYSLTSITVQGELIANHKLLQQDVLDINPSWNNGKFTKAPDFENLTGTVTLTSGHNATHSGSGWWMDKNGGLHITGFVNNPSTATNDATPWKAYKSEITAVYTTKGASVSSCLGLFADCPNLTHAYLNNLNTYNVTNMSAMFSNCKKLEAIYFDELDTSKVTDMYGMFFSCEALTALDVSGFNTSKVTDMTSMFFGCSGLERIDVSNFDTTNVTSISGLFALCPNLKEVNLGQFNTANVTEMQLTFMGCSSLKELDLRSFNTAKTETYLMMFYGCTNLEKLNISNFNIASSASVGIMFYDCPVFEEINVNQSVLNMTADQLIAISPVWYNKANGTSYETEAALKKTTGKVTLVSDINNSQWKLPFTDLTYGTWQYNTAKYVYDRKIILGTTATTFSPNAKMTRAQFIVILWRMAGSPKVAYANPYTDVPQTHFAATAIQWAKSQGLASGYNDGSFKPNAPMTREQFCAFMQRYAKYLGKDTSTHGTTYTQCVDGNQVNKTFATPVQWAYERGFIAANGQIMPRSSITRIQAAAVLQRFMEYYKIS